MEKIAAHIRDALYRRLSGIPNYPIEHLAGVDFVWVDIDPNFCRGYFTVTDPGFVRISSYYKDRVCTNKGGFTPEFDSLCATMAHECKHRWDMRRIGIILYMICKVPPLRQIVLEWPAEKIEKMVNDGLGVDEAIRL